MMKLMMTVLEHVSFDKELFKKELLKAILRIPSNDFAQFKIWCYFKFKGEFRDELDQAFKLKAAIVQES